MSGGAFDYVQYRIQQVADDVDGYIQNVISRRVDEYGYQTEELSEGTLERIYLTRLTLVLASKMLQRVDWLASGDDGEEGFNSRWDSECREDIYSLKKALAYQIEGWDK